MLSLALAISMAAPAQAGAAYLAGVGWVAQTLNNCGPASVIAATSAYGIAFDQRELAKILKAKPTGYMTADVIDPFLRPYGLRAQRYKEGDIWHIKRLIDQGIPVIVLQYLDRVGGIPHFRTVRGYDDAAQVIWFSDSMYGANSYLSYQDFDRLWNIYNREFIPIFPEGYQATVSRAVNPAIASAQVAAGGSVPKTSVPKTSAPKTNSTPKR